MLKACPVANQTMLAISTPAFNTVQGTATNIAAGQVTAFNVSMPGAAAGGQVKSITVNRAACKLCATSGFLHLGIYRADTRALVLQTAAQSFDPRTASSIMVPLRQNLPAGVVNFYLAISNDAC
jgi:hypothetical protein